MDDSLAYCAAFKSDCLSTIKAVAIGCPVYLECDRAPFTLYYHRKMNKTRLGGFCLVDLQNTKARSHLLDFWQHCPDLIQKLLMIDHWLGDVAIRTALFEQVFAIALVRVRCN